MKKEENDELNLLLVQPTHESREVLKSSSSSVRLVFSEVDIKKPERSPPSNGVEKSANLMNGVIDLDESSSDSDDCGNLSESKDTRAPEDFKADLKKEEAHEEKLIADEMVTNVNEVNPFSGDSSENYNFDFNIEDDLPDDFLGDENPLAECESDNLQDAGDNEPENAASVNNENSYSNDDRTTIENDSTGDTDENDSNENESADNEASEAQDTACENEVGSDESVPIEAGTAATELPAAEQSHGADDDDEGDPLDTVDPKPAEETEKDGDSEASDNKRPPSHESVGSATSSSSLTIRSASEVNKMVIGSNVVVKTERESGGASEKVEKPGLSVLNPSQLGATDNAGGENLLQSSNFVQSGDTMVGFMGSSLQNGVPLQCDVCDIQFPDNLSLEDHRAVLGHYKCHYSPECASFVFQSIADFTNHQQTIHGVLGQSPVQQLQHQVQTLPIRYQRDQSNNYQKMPSYPPGSQQVHGVPSMAYPASPNNAQIRQYNVPGSPRLQIGAVRSVLPNQLNSNLKRIAPTQPSPSRLTPPKRRCDGFPTRNGDADCKVVSHQKPDNTDDVVAQLSKSITITARQETQKKSDTAAVANMLANRGITVSSVPNKINRNSNPVTMLNLNSAVSLIPTNAKQNSGFAVPQGRLSGVRQQTPPGRMQTVDLTGPDHSARNKQLNRTSKFLCQICDRSFFNQEQLNQHMMSHRSGGLRKQLPYRCNTCTASYPNQQALMQHRQICHRDAVAGTNEMVIPIVDLKQTGALQRLQAIGIHHMIPLSALGTQASNGTFGIPILPFSSDRNTISNLTNSGISNLLPIGPLKALGR